MGGFIRLSWRFVCLFLKSGDCEEVSEKHTMAAHFAQLLQIANLLAAGVD